MAIRLFLRSLLAMMVFGFTAPAHSCSCISQNNIEHHYAAATTIFVGRVVATNPVASREDMPEWRGMVARYQLVEIIKATVPPVPHVLTGEGHGDCGVPLVAGVSYVFFAGPRGQIDICSGTRAYVAGVKGFEEYLGDVRSLAAGKRASQRLKLPLFDLSYQQIP